MNSRLRLRVGYALRDGSVLLAFGDRQLRLPPELAEELANEILECAVVVRGGATVPRAMHPSWEELED